jgi:hypothetical protein
LSKKIFGAPKFIAKTIGVGLIARWLYKSIYDSKIVEDALKSAFSNDCCLFGISRDRDDNTDANLNFPSVAVTTTVNRECKLFTNYNLGNYKQLDGASGLHLDATIAIWEV